MFLAHAADLVTLSPPFSQMIIFRIGQGVSAVPGEPTAFSHRDARYLFHPITAWLDPADGAKMIAATRAFAAAMRPFSTGASYVNFTHEADRFATPTAMLRTPAWWPSRTPTTRPTCSGSTRTSGPASPPRSPRSPELLDGEQISLLEEARDALTGEHGALAALVTARLSIASSLVIAEAQWLKLATEAVRLARAATDDVALAASLAALCDAIPGPDHCTERCDRATEIIEIAGRLRDPWP